MKSLVTAGLFFILCCGSVLAGVANQQQAAEQLGYRILAVQSALTDPLAEESMDAILALGRDSRYYLLTRGWLSEVLRGDLSILSSNPQHTSALILRRIQLLESALRAIDLE